MERHMSRSDTLTAIPARNCSSDHVNCCSNLPINGLTDRNDGLKFCLRNLRTYRWLTDSDIPCE